MLQLYKGGLKESVVFTDVHSSGRMVGELDNKKIYTGRAIPGEIAHVRMDRRKRGFYSGVCENIIEPSEYRVKPRCIHAEICGGCNWQHIEYPFQLKLKTQILSNALKKYNIPYSDIKPVIASPLLYEYRNKTEYSFWESGYKIQNGEYQEMENVVGFHPMDRRDITIDIDECFVQNSLSRLIYERVKQVAISLKLPFYHYEKRTGFIRNLVIRNNTQGYFQVIIGFLDSDTELMNRFLYTLNPLMPQQVQLFYTKITSPEKGYADGDILPFEANNSITYLEETMNGLTFRYGPKCFFQPNPWQANTLFSKVKEMASLRGNELVYDLYTGVGTIALHLAGNAQKVIGIEDSGEAIDYAGKNAESNKITNAQFICGDVLETFKNEFVEHHGLPEVVVLDPPRSGTLIEIKKTILFAQPRKIIYVSCNPVSLAYDLTMLTNGYKIKEIQPFDMFPHTHHIETVVLLEKE